jgi:hypothetical protein
MVSATGRFGTKVALEPSDRMMTVLRSRYTLSHIPVVATVALLAGCGGSGLACTAIGCASGLTVSAPATIHGHKVRRMKICLDGSCKAVPVVRNGHARVLARVSVATKSLGQQRDVKVSLTLESASNTNLTTAQASVRLHRFAPNGVSCGPVCYESEVTVNRGGTISAGSA